MCIHFPGDWSFCGCIVDCLHSSSWRQLNNQNPSEIGHSICKLNAKKLGSLEEKRQIDKVNLAKMHTETVYCTHVVFN